MPPEVLIPFEEARAAQEPWGEPDLSLLEDARGSMPAFPLDEVSPGWRRWIADTAHAAGTAPDYVALGLFASVAALCGAGVVTHITPTWGEPLVLWQALVGLPSSGKSPALAAVRRQLAFVEEELRSGDSERRAHHALSVERGEETGSFVPTQIIVADATMEALADVVAGNPRGVILWRDELTAWLANLNRYSHGGSDRAHWLEAWAAAGVTVNRRSRSQPLVVPSFPVSIVGSIQPDRLGEALQGSDDGMAARFLYAWPEAPPYVPLLDRRVPDDDQALGRLYLIARYAGRAAEPWRLKLDHKGLEIFDAFLARLHEIGTAGNVDGLLAGWLGKGRGTAARLAAVLYLLGWSEGGSDQRPPEWIPWSYMINATAIWEGYLLPHAQAVFNQAGRGDPDRLARRAARWLKRSPNVTVIGRESVRREIFSQTITAETADKVLARLEEAQFLRPAPVPITSAPGRKPRRWRVNPRVHRERAA